jgi:hypothetical protein
MPPGKGVTRDTAAAEPLAIANPPRLPDPELEHRPVAAPELRIGGIQREAPATNVATM